MYFEPASAPAIAARPEPARKRSTAINMLLFLSAPFVGLLYAILLPFVGLGTLAWIGGKAAMQSPRVREGLAFTRFMLKLVFAPLIGLVYVLTYPLVGLVMLGWAGARASAGAKTLKQ